MSGGKSFEELMQDPNFRASFHQIEAAHLRVALKLCCADHGSVRLGFEQVEDKVNYYLNLAQGCEDMIEEMITKGTSAEAQELLKHLRRDNEASSSEQPNSATDS